MDLKNIHSVRVYQAVKFNNKLSTYFVTEDTVRMPSAEIEIVPNVGVSVKSKEDHVIIPFPNISAIRMNTEESVSKREARKADLEKPARAIKVSKVK